MPGGFQLVGYMELKDNIIAAIKSYANEKSGYNGNVVNDYIKDNTKPRKFTDKTGRISSVRQAQIQILLSIIRCLENSSDLDALAKTNLLNAVAHYTRNQILKSYEDSLLALFTSAKTGSTLYNQLTTSLALELDKMPGDNDLYNLYLELQTFLIKEILDGKYPFFTMNCMGGFLFSLSSRTNELNPNSSVTKLGENPYRIFAYSSESESSTRCGVPDLPSPTPMVSLHDLHISR